MAMISINNGMDFLNAHEAMPLIDERHLWDAVVSMMENDVRERVHYELAPCSEEAFLSRYLEIAEEDLVIG